MIINNHLTTVVLIRLMMEVMKNMEQYFFDIDTKLRIQQVETRHETLHSSRIFQLLKTLPNELISMITRFIPNRHESAIQMLKQIYEKSHIYNPRISPKLSFTKKKDSYKLCVRYYYIHIMTRPKAFQLWKSYFNTTINRDKKYLDNHFITSKEYYKNFYRMKSEGFSDFELHIDPWYGKNYYSFKYY